MKNENYITVLGFMIKELHLKGSELLAYALIYGFSQDEQTTFKGSIKYISEWLGLTRPATIDVLKKLELKKFIKKEQIIDKNRVPHNTYSIIEGQYRNNIGGSKETILPPLKKLYYPSKETLPNNNNYNNIRNSKDKKAVVAAGICAHTREGDEEKNEQLKKILAVYPACKNLGLTRTEPEFCKKSFSDKQIEILCHALQFLPEAYSRDNFRFLPSSANFFKNNYDEIFLAETLMPDVPDYSGFTLEPADFQL